MSKKKAQTLSIKKTRKKPAHAARKKKPTLAVREPQPSWIEEFNKLSEPFRLIPWDPFRGFEWPVEYELPTRVPYVDVIDSGNEYVVKAEVPGLKKRSEEHTSELQSHSDLVCRLLLEKKKNNSEQTKRLKQQCSDAAARETALEEPVVVRVTHADEQRAQRRADDHHGEHTTQQRGHVL